MNHRQALLTHVASKSHKLSIPELRPGMTVRVSQKIKEGEKERIQNFEGLVIAVRGGQGIGGTFTVRKIVEGIGVEKVFPLHGATITKVQVVKEAKVRRSKLYFTRKLRGKKARMKETYLDGLVYDEEKAQADKKAKLDAAEKLAEEKAKEEALRQAQDKAEEAALRQAQDGAKKAEAEKVTEVAA